MFNLAVKNFFEKNLPLKVYGNLKRQVPVTNNQHTKQTHKITAS